MIIPIDQISAETLDNIIESFILREGTDYGLHEWSLDEKKQQLNQQLINGEIVVVYSELHETVNLMPRSQFNAQS